MKTMILLFAVFMLSGGAAMSPEKKTLLLFDFSKSKDFELWQVINDGVMGGISRSDFKRGEDVAVFSGEVSLENYGGFCSASSRPVKNYDLSGFKGVAIRVKGDGKDYKATLKTDASFSGFSYQYVFSTQSGTWITVKAPFSKFLPFFRGVRQNGEGGIDSGKIRSMGFIIADKQEGPFRLEIASIEAY